MRRDGRPKLSCANGWTATEKWASCNYTGGHFCIKGFGHVGPCKCSCGSTSRTKPPKDGVPIVYVTIRAQGAAP